MAIMRRVAIYLRVSTQRQEKGLESQLRALREHCSRMNEEKLIDVVYEIMTIRFILRRVHISGTLLDTYNTCLGE